MNEDKIQEAIVFAIEKIKEDYENNLLCHEGSLQSALYMHLRNALKLEKNEKIWNELRLRNEDEKNISIDLAIVNLDSESEEDHLKNQIQSIPVALEIKYVQVSGKIFNEISELIESNEVIVPLIHNTSSKDIDRLKKLFSGCYLMKGDGPITLHSAYFVGLFETKDKRTEGYKARLIIIDINTQGITCIKNIKIQ